MKKFKVRLFMPHKHTATHETLAIKTNAKRFLLVALPYVCAQVPWKKLDTGQQL